MSRERTPIEQLRLAGSPNLKRALGYKPAPGKAAGKQVELERMFEELKSRREELLADVKENGLLVFEDHYDQHRLYQRRVPNPVLKLLQATERQLVSLAKILAAAPAEDNKGDGLDEFADIFERHHVA